MTFDLGPRPNLWQDTNLGPVKPVAGLGYGESRMAVLKSSVAADWPRTEFFL
jgi:hypothetical protein